ncbi:MAG: ATP-binding protein, partial [Pseudomonadota bacterium]|nr:ATP-binding protein [Pseudomonadota bacterium]
AAAEALPDDARGARLRRSLDEAGRRVDAVATGFLALARAEAGLVTEARGPVDLLAVARGLATTRPALHVGPGAFVVHGAAEALETALRNLVDNGLVEGDVHIEAHDGTLVVWDTGPGVPEALRDRLFEAWVTGRAGGTGLGLALARAIVEAHGGTLRLEGANRFVFAGLRG